MAIRGQFTINGRSFAVASSAFIEVFSTGGSTVWGNVINDGLPVSMAASPQQLLLATAGTAYVFDLVANTLTPIAGATFSGPVSQVGICDDFFLALISNSKEFYVSAPLDANDWTTNGSSIISVFPDNVISMIVQQREIWFLSDTQTQPYYDSGKIFPFDVVSGTLLQYGIAAKWSIVRLNNTLIWLGSDEHGQGVVFQATGYSPARISNHAIEFAIQGYSQISDAIAFSYQDQGHYFYVLYFPTPSKTWVYDTATGMWHERGYWDLTIGDYKAAHYQNHTFNFGKHLVGDWSSDTIYQMAIPVENGGIWSFADDAGNPIRRARRAPHISKNQKRQFFSELQVFIDSGLGPIPPLQGSTFPSTIYLQDSNGVIWGVQVLDTGNLTSTVAPSGSPQAIVLTDPSGTNSFLLGITTGGLLTTTVSGTTGTQAYQLISNTGQTIFNLGVLLAGNLTIAGGGIVGRGPRMTLRWSDDSTHTWSNDRTADAGQAGEYRKRVRFLRLGSGRDRIFEISASDPIGWRVTDGYLEYMQGTGV